MPPRRPDFAAAMELMRRQSSNHQEQGFNLILPHANFFVDELIAEFQSETDYGLKCWLLELLGHARSEKTYQLFVEQLTVGDLTLRDWAVRGIQKLNTKEGKALLKQRGLTAP